VSILSSICIIGYQGSLDSTALKTNLTGIVESLNSYKRVATDKNKIVTVEFFPGTIKIQVKVGTGADAELLENKGLDGGTDILNRSLKFIIRGYRWPDGAATPATFTYYPSGTIIGGVVRYGSGFADAKILIKNNHVTWDF